MNIQHTQNHELATLSQQTQQNGAQSLIVGGAASNLILNGAAQPSFYLIQQPSNQQQPQPTDNYLIANNAIQMAIKQPQQNQQQQFQIQPNLQQPRIIIQNNGQQFIQQHTSNNNAATAFLIPNSATQASGSGGNSANGNGQIFLNINNRIVPIQAVNLKPTATTTVNNLQPNNQLLLNQQQQQRIQIINTGQPNAQQMIQIRPAQQQTPQPIVQTNQQVVYAAVEGQNQQTQQQQLLILSNGQNGQLFFMFKYDFIFN